KRRFQVLDVLHRRARVRNDVRLHLRRDQTQLIRKRISLIRRHASSRRHTNEPVTRSLHNTLQLLLSGTILLHRSNDIPRRRRNVVQRRLVIAALLSRDVQRGTVLRELRSGVGNRLLKVALRITSRQDNARGLLLCSNQIRQRDRLVCNLRRRRLIRPRQLLLRNARLFVSQSLLRGSLLRIRQRRSLGIERTR